jgi:predicted transposase/invertase (TIGR01784 family)
LREKRRVLADFLSAALDMPLEEFQDMTLVNPNLKKDYRDYKLVILDIKIETKSHKSIDVEVQVRALENIWKRVQFYTSKPLVEQLNEGQEYKNLTRAICILIADFTLLKDKKAYHHRFRMYDESEAVALPDFIQEINILEIPKALGEDGTALGAWLNYFAAKTKEDFMKVSQNRPAITEAWGYLKVLSEDEKARQLAEAREKARRDEFDLLNGAFNKGEQKGRLEGKQERTLEIAQASLRNNISLEVIADCTGLSIEDLKQMAATLSDS